MSHPFTSSSDVVVSPPKRLIPEPDSDPLPPPAKLLKTSTEADTEPLLPGLPDHVAQLILSRLPPSLVFNITRSWRRVLYTPSFPPFLSLYSLYLHTATNSLRLSAFDPVSCTWLNLPPPPQRRVIIRHPCFVSRYLPIQSVTVSGSLVLLAATAEHLVPAFPRPVVFNPSKQNWEFSPKMNYSRRWCAGGACGGAVYAASGVGGRYTTRIARSVERFDLNGFVWEKMRDLEGEKMSREAVGAVGWRGKLLVADVAAKEGSVYDVRSDMWREMTDGMIGGWRGPAAAMDEETLYSVDQSLGILRRYDEEGDTWEDILCVPELRGAEQIAAGGGRVCVVQNGGGSILVVDVVASPSKYWKMDTPEVSQTIALHILPRICRSDL